MNLEENNNNLLIYHNTIIYEYLKKLILPEIPKLLNLCNFDIPEIIINDKNILFIKELVKLIYTKYLLFNKNLYYQTNNYKEKYYEFFLINIILNINIKINNNINIIELKKILYSIKKYLLLHINIIIDDNYNKIIDYINITNIFNYLYHKFKNYNNIKYLNSDINNFLYSNFSIKIENFEFIFKYYFNLFNNILSNNKILNFNYIYKIINEKKFKYNSKISNIDKIYIKNIKKKINKIINNKNIKLSKQIYFYQNKIKLLQKYKNNNIENKINYLYSSINNIKKQIDNNNNIVIKIFNDIKDKLLFNDIKLNQINIKKLNHFKKIFFNKEILKINYEDGFVFIQYNNIYDKKNNLYMLTGGDNVDLQIPINDDINYIELNQIKKSMEEKINEIKEDILAAHNEQNSENILSSTYELIQLQTKYELINSQINSYQSPNKIALQGIKPAISIDELNTYKNIYKCITKKNIKKKIVKKNNNKLFINNNILENKDDPILNLFKSNYKCITKKKQNHILYNDLSDFEKKKKILESKIASIPTGSNEKILFNDNIIINITQSIINYVGQMTSLEGASKQTLLNKINEIMDVDLKINKTFKKMIFDIAKIVENTDSVEINNGMFSLKKKLVELQKNLFLFQIRTIFSKFTQVTNLVTQNLDPIYNEHNSEKFMLLQKFNSLIDVIDNKITTMNNYINDIPNQQSKENKIQKYSIESDTQGNISMKTESVNADKLKDEELLYIQGMNLLKKNENGINTVDLGINQEITKYESLYKSSKIIYLKNLERYKDSENFIIEKKDKYEIEKQSNDYFKISILAGVLYNDIKDHLYIQGILLNSAKNYYKYISTYIKFINDYNIHQSQNQLDFQPIDITEENVEQNTMENNINIYTCGINKNFYLQKILKQEQKEYFKKYDENHEHKQFSPILNFETEEEKEQRKIEQEKMKEKQKQQKEKQKEEKEEENFNLIKSKLINNLNHLNNDTYNNFLETTTFDHIYKKSLITINLILDKTNDIGLQDKYKNLLNNKKIYPEKIQANLEKLNSEINIFHIFLISCLTKIFEIFVADLTIDISDNYQQNIISKDTNEIKPNFNVIKNFNVYISYIEENIQYPKNIQNENINLIDELEHNEQKIDNTKQTLLKQLNELHTISKDLYDKYNTLNDIYNIIDRDNNIIQNEIPNLQKEFNKDKNDFAIKLAQKQEEEKKLAQKAEADRLAQEAKEKAGKETIKLSLNEKIEKINKQIDYIFFIKNSADELKAKNEALNIDHIVGADKTLIQLNISNILKNTQIISKKISEIIRDNSGQNFNIIEYYNKIKFDIQNTLTDIDNKPLVVLELDLTKYEEKIKEIYTLVHPLNDLLQEIISFDVKIVEIIGRYKPKITDEVLKKMKLVTFTNLMINEKYNNDEIKSYLIRKAQLDVINRIKLKELGNKNFHIDIDINSLN